MINNNYDQRIPQIENGFILADLLQMNSAVNYVQWIFSRINSFMDKKVLEVLAGIGNFTNEIINNLEQLIIVEPNAACQKDFQIKRFNKIVPFISFTENKIGCPMGLSLVSVSRKEK